MTINFESPGTVALAASLICLLVYLRTLASDFVSFDDTFYVLNNEAIRQLDWNLVVWAFTAPMANWVPLTHISLAVDSGAQTADGKQDEYMEKTLLVVDNAQPVK